MSEAGYRILGSENDSFSATSNGSTILARPFTNATTGAPTAVLIGFPGLSSGTVGVEASSHNFQGVHLDMTQQFNCNKYLRFDAILGYRFFQYDEDLPLIAIGIMHPRLVLPRVAAIGLHLITSY